MDFLLDGMATGDIASRLLSCGLSANTLRPWVENGRTYINVKNSGGAFVPQQIGNTGTLRKDEWIQIDTAVTTAAKGRLKAVGDLMSRGLSVRTDGMGVTVYQTERMSDISEAEVTMDGLESGTNSRPVYDQVNLPLPIIHKDFRIPVRQLEASRRYGTSIDLSQAALMGEKVAEMIEKLLIGEASTFAFGGGSVYGYKNYPYAIPASITPPTDSSWTPVTTQQEVNAMVQASIQAFNYGPWVLYYGPSWHQYMNGDYYGEVSINASPSTKTLLNRLKEIGNIEDVSMLDYLTGWDMVLVQMNQKTVRMVNGLNITTVQWQDHGGFQLCMKVLAIMVPQLRCDINNHCGIVHATA